MGSIYGGRTGQRNENAPERRFRNLKLEIRTVDGLSVIPKTSEFEEQSPAIGHNPQKIPRNGIGPKNTEPQRRLIEPSTKAEREKNFPLGGSLGRKAHWPMNKIEARSTGEMKKSGQNLADWQKMSTFAPLFSLSQCDGVLPCKKQLE